MDDHTRIIVKEIEFWKEHKLLPEHYCNYLMALYTNGNSVEQTKRRRWIEFSQNVLLLLLLPFSFLVIYFTQFPVLLQLGIFILFLVYATWSCIYFWKKRSKYFHLAFVIMLLLCLLYSVYIVNDLIVLDWVVYFVILVNFIGWIQVGMKAKYKYLTVSGLIGLVFSIFYIVL